MRALTAPISTKSTRSSRTRPALLSPRANLLDRLWNHCNHCNHWELSGLLASIKTRQFCILLRGDPKVQFGNHVLGVVTSHQDSTGMIPAYELPVVYRVRHSACFLRLCHDQAPGCAFHSTSVRTDSRFRDARIHAMNQVFTVHRGV
jgi:hypothetical protein